MNNLKSYRTLFLILFITNTIFAQSTYFGDDAIKWMTNEVPTDNPNIKSNLVILDEYVEFYFPEAVLKIPENLIAGRIRPKNKLSKSLVIKINSTAGANILQNYRLPESFDPAFELGYYKQGREARIKTPPTNEYKVVKFMGRKFRNNKWAPLTFKLKYETQRWVAGSGEFKDEQLFNFQLEDIKSGDIIEVYYESEFQDDYGSSCFYFASAYPKLKTEFSFVYNVHPQSVNYNYLLPLYIPDSSYQKVRTADKKYLVFKDIFKLKNLTGINYLQNSKEGKNLPHLFVDFSVVWVSNDLNPILGSDFTPVRPRNFEWITVRDTSGDNFTKIYDKQSASLRKLASQFIPLGSDSANRVFLRSYCDTLNSFRYITMNHLFYNESHLYNVSSTDHLLKRRLLQNTADNTLFNILYENKIFFYVMDIQDKRYCEHDTTFNAHYKYSEEITVIPYKNSYLYLLPRYNGVKYFLNELPFYYEGVFGSLYPYNFQENTKNKSKAFNKFIKTHKGTYNENTRTENATVKISIDSLKARLTTKESLSGQFSTVLRHLYLNEYIDSTIAPYYFRKCTDKPLASNSKIKLSSKINEFPFRYTFNCSQEIKLESASTINLKNWFSFLLSNKILPETPNHDYYFDFDYSDSYNFLLDFNSPVEISNSSAFNKNINNEFYSLQSEIIKNSENAYLIKVAVVIKEIKVPFDKTNLLTELAAHLDELNNFSLSITKK